MKATVTLEQVALASGVSVSTVSRILNGSANVSPNKRAAVEQAVAQLDYKPNVLARGLARGRTMSIGVVTQDVSSPFYGDMLRGIEHGLSGSGYLPIFADGHWHPEEENAAIDVLLGRKVDALIVLGGAVADERLLEVSATLPLLVFGRQIPEIAEQCLRLNNERGAYLLTKHLIEFGHRRIAHIAGPSAHRDACDRLAGYRAALTDAGLNVIPELILEGDFLESSGFMAATRLFEGREVFSAIFAANDQMAYGARLALHRKGVRVPDDISLVGFDDLPSSTFCTPPLTTVRQPTYDLGIAVAGSVLRMLAGERPRLPHIELQLVLRESTALLRPGLP
ncbi:LacI family DNA-binding transcriptional regulator [Deinococcus peraridilitoris]|uniref:Transcriptional regulator n=1 Tax=Deinococcus peraridilitoris (strain DSM 19664 / LMG 22246 / CIP 109416 / KR-200) TaxID=937777 RepID=L0A0F6_DEIPD|nr:substrate-binding domain-containing protein [Deinococcus peraridilitoris]AFZ66632.1 transcriptional regulator [Deinococcus peraridilitoris DSM 19664]